MLHETNDENIYAEGLYDELEITRQKLYDLTSENHNFCDDDILAVSKQLDELLVKDIRLKRSQQ